MKHLLTASLVLLLTACGQQEPAVTSPVDPGPAAGHQRLVRIMPLGDSITQGRYQGGAATYRRALWQALRRGGVQVDFVGSQNILFDGPDPRADYDQDHEGHWGWTVDQVLDKAAGWTRLARPDVVLLHLGTNDLGRMEEGRDAVVAATVEEMAGLVAVLRAGNPRVKVLMAQVIPTANPQFNPLIETYNTALAILAGKLTTAESPVVIVDQHTGFDPRTDLADGVHPNEQGAVKMMRVWLRGLMEVGVVE